MFCCVHSEVSDDIEPVLDYEVRQSIPFTPKKLDLNADIKKPEDGPLQEVLENSLKFSKEYPVKSVLCSSLLETYPYITQEILEHNANSAYPLLHEAALQLYETFLSFKKKHGSGIERKLYNDMTVIDLVQRMLEKRSLVFCGFNDSYMLQSGESGFGGWENVGTDQETSPLILENCLSYDEIKLSAFLSVSCHSVFINDGNRRNSGVPSNSESIQRHGVVVGLVGPRLSHGPVMDYHEIIISKQRNTKKNGYGKIVEQSAIAEWRNIWAKFYGIPNLPLFEDVKKGRVDNEEASSRFCKLRTEMFFDNELYSKRICIAVEAFLLEAEARAAAENKKAYIHVVGIGLGTWMLSSHQEKVFLDSFGKCLMSLQHVLPHVSDVNFGWFKEKSCGGVENGGIVGNAEKGIRIHFSNRPPHTKLDDEEKLLVVSYASDGNSFPGNEYWDGSLTSSGDPANACSTQVSELHNPCVNRRKICGANLHIASRRWGILHISDYIKVSNNFVNEQ